MFPSDEARCLLRKLSLAPVDELSPDGVADLRASAEAEFRPRAERALERHRIAVERRTLGGVPCLLARPVEGECERTILYFYGGGYITGSAYQDLTVAAPLSRLAQASVVMPEYRLAPEHPFPAACDDAFRVYRALSPVQETKPFLVAGESAGGNLALVTVLAARTANLHLPSALALLSPWCDLSDGVDGGDGLAANEGRDPTLCRAYVALAATLYAGEVDRRAPAVSPLYDRFDARFPPTTITSGGRDLLLHQCLRLAQALRESGVQVDLRVWDELWHVFEFYDELPEAARSLSEVAAFLVRHA